MNQPTPDAEACAHFAARLRHETDPSDVHRAMHDAAGHQLPFVVVDTRDAEAWTRGRLPGAVHLPGPRIPTDAAALLPHDVPLVVYCWGPGCNGATRAALALARQGYRVREMIGGFEYWAREGLPVETDAGVTSREPDPLTAPAVSCGC